MEVGNSMGPSSVPSVEPNGSVRVQSPIAMDVGGSPVYLHQDTEGQTGWTSSGGGGDRQLSVSEIDEILGSSVSIGSWATESAKVIEANEPEKRKEEDRYRRRSPSRTHLLDGIISFSVKNTFQI